MKYGIFFKPPSYSKRPLPIFKDYICFEVRTDDDHSPDSDDPDRILKFLNMYWRKEDNLLRLQEKGTIYRLGNRLHSCDTDLHRFKKKYPWINERIHNDGDIIYIGKDLKKSDSDEYYLEVPMLSCNDDEIPEYCDEHEWEYAFIYYSFTRKYYIKEMI